MKASGLGDVDAVKDQYLQHLNRQLELQIGKELKEIVREDPTLDQNVMGSANFLQMYVNTHPEVAFILTYTHPKTNAATDWIMTGARPPTKVVHIHHIGSVDGGHFMAKPVDEFDIARATEAQRVRMMNV